MHGQVHCTGIPRGIARQRRGQLHRSLCQQVHGGSQGPDPPSQDHRSPLTHSRLTLFLSWPPFLTSASFISHPCSLVLCVLSLVPLPTRFQFNQWGGVAVPRSRPTNPVPTPVSHACRGRLLRRRWSNSSKQVLHNNSRPWGSNHCDCYFRSNHYVCEGTVENAWERHKREDSGFLRCQSCSAEPTCISCVRSRPQFHSPITTTTGRPTDHHPSFDRWINHTLF